jgi:hypothetical protein
MIPKDQGSFFAGYGTCAVTGVLGLAIVFGSVLRPAVDNGEISNSMKHSTEIMRKIVVDMKNMRLLGEAFDAANPHLTYVEKQAMRYVMGSLNGKCDSGDAVFDARCNAVKADAVARGYELTP